MGLSEDMFESFLKYQAMIGKEFRRMQKKYGLVPINGNRTPEEIHSDLSKEVHFKVICQVCGNSWVPEPFKRGILRYGQLPKACQFCHRRAWQEKQP